MLLAQGSHLHRNKISFRGPVKSTVLWNSMYFIALDSSLFSQDYHFFFIGVCKPIGFIRGTSTKAVAVYTGSHTLQLSPPGHPHSEVQYPPLTMAHILFLSITILLCMSLCLKCLFSCFLISNSHLAFKAKLQHHSIHDLDSCFPSGFIPTPQFILLLFGFPEKQIL